MTQQQRIIEILKRNGNRGMNSYDYRMEFIQLPVRIKELKEKGYLITTRQKDNRSVDYILLGVPKETPRYVPQPAYYNFIGNVAVKVDVEEIQTKQEALL